MPVGNRVAKLIFWWLLLFEIGCSQAAIEPFDEALDRAMGQDKDLDYSTEVVTRRARVVTFYLCRGQVPTAEEVFYHEEEMEWGDRMSDVLCRNALPEADASNPAATLAACKANLEDYERVSEVLLRLIRRSLPCRRLESTETSWEARQSRNVWYVFVKHRGEELLVIQHPARIGALAGVYGMFRPMRIRGYTLDAIFLCWLRYLQRERVGPTELGTRDHWRLEQCRQ